LAISSSGRRPRRSRSQAPAARRERRARADSDSIATSRRSEDCTSDSGTATTTMCPGDTAEPPGLPAAVSSTWTRQRVVPSTEPVLKKGSLPVISSGSSGSAVMLESWILDSTVPPAARRSA
jgi:hypothetical protein